jgi:hypothetical protein
MAGQPIPFAGNPTSLTGPTWSNVGRVAYVDPNDPAHAAWTPADGNLFWVMGPEFTTEPTNYIHFAEWIPQGNPHAPWTWKVFTSTPLTGTGGRGKFTASNSPGGFNTIGPNTTAIQLYTESWTAWDQYSGFGVKWNAADFLTAGPVTGTKYIYCTKVGTGFSGNNNGTVKLRVTNISITSSPSYPVIELDVTHVDGDTIIFNPDLPGGVDGDLLGITTSGGLLNGGLDTNPQVHFWRIGNGLTPVSNPDFYRFVELITGVSPGTITNNSQAQSNLAAVGIWCSKFNLLP